MVDFILLTTLGLCIVAMIGENSNPRGMNIFWYKVNVKVKEYYKVNVKRRAYWKALTEYDSGNNKGNGPR
jgi:hypothetical protein